jgi:tripartite-type tricarboxylate transporter receptor subunit TctC
VLKTPETSERLSREGLDPVGSTPSEFARHLESESKKWARAVQIAGTKAE